MAKCLRCLSCCPWRAQGSPARNERARGPGRPQGTPHDNSSMTPGRPEIATEVQALDLLGADTNDGGSRRREYVRETSSSTHACNPETHIGNQKDSAIVASPSGPTLRGEQTCFNLHFPRLRGSAHPFIFCHGSRRETKHRVTCRCNNNAPPPC